jgi:hypothetical protein
VVVDGSAETRSLRQLPSCFACIAEGCTWIGTNPGYPDASHGMNICRELSRPGMSLRIERQIQAMLHIMQPADVDMISVEEKSGHQKSLNPCLNPPESQGAELDCSLIGRNDTDETLTVCASWNQAFLLCGITRLTLHQPNCTPPKGGHTCAQGQESTG